MKLKTALTIAGSDSSGGAGIQADLKTMLANGVYGMSAITAMTAQNTAGVTAIQESTAEFLGQQLDAVFADIRPDAAKIGMVASAPLIAVIADRLGRYEAKNVVLDPVMVATSGASLMKEDGLRALKEQLLPRVALVTPNIPEAQVLAGMPIGSWEDMAAAARKIGMHYGCAVLLKGGHSAADADDLLWFRGELLRFRGQRIENPNSHGTGCTLSAAIAANLAKGHSLPEAVGLAKEYVSGALAAMLDLGAGSGPLHHGFDLQSRFAAGGSDV